MVIGIGMGGINFINKNEQDTHINLYPIHNIQQQQPPFAMLLFITKHRTNQTPQI